MNKPKNINDALDRVHNLLDVAGHDLETYLENPSDFSPEYFLGIKDCVLDAHMLVTWVKDNLKERSDV